ncbi:DUF3284 domain-containing protein [Mollicutes bacterium LVI A0078]|nr:DUF3284 domain-containing protein [Mollicutes bacterium LVI A0075]WOO91605.1 DUF3284 domain-containing protein [Mollicutes bacterium LVI A0078]
MAKPREHTFIASPEKVYAAISKMLLLNAEAVDEKYSDCTDISKINYTYGEKTKVSVKVTDVIENQMIKYHTAMEKRERFDVQFNLEPDGENTKMIYTIDIITDVKRIETNYNFMSIFYTWKQKKAFKNMCTYLQSVIDEN